jgi:hypothetical protein
MRENSILVRDAVRLAKAAIGAAAEEKGEKKAPGEGLRGAFLGALRLPLPSLCVFFGGKMLIDKFTMPLYDIFAISKERKKQNKKQRRTFTAK